MKTATEPTITFTSNGLTIENIESERISPAYAPFETVFRKTATIAPSAGDPDRLNITIRTTRNAVITGVHIFPFNSSNRSIVEHFFGVDLATKLFELFA
jgi:hypothetical protein